jgi:hypothetical protein
MTQKKKWLERQQYSLFLNSQLAGTVQVLVSERGPLLEEAAVQVLRPVDARRDSQCLSHLFHYIHSSLTATYLPPSVVAIHISLPSPNLLLLGQAPSRPLHTLARPLPQILGTKTLIDTLHQLYQGVNRGMAPASMLISAMAMATCNDLHYLARTKRKTPWLRGCGPQVVLIFIITLIISQTLVGSRMAIQYKTMFRSLLSPLTWPT